MGDEDKGFTVRDRRAFSPDGESGEETPSENNQTQPADKEPPPPASQEEEPQAQASDYTLPPVDFSGFILSLSHAAMMHLGQLPDPLTGKAQADFNMARHTIDTIAMIKDKTQGNLDEEEQRLIDHALSQLRLAYVHLSSQPKQKE